jgi:hypothetical protein
MALALKEDGCLTAVDGQKINILVGELTPFGGNEIANQLAIQDKRHSNKLLNTECVLGRIGLSFWY